MARIQSFRGIIWKYKWIALGILTLLVRFCFDLFPEATEQIYSRGFFLVIRWIFDHSFGFLPMHSFYVLIPLLIFLLVRRIRKARKANRTRLPWGKRLLKWSLGLLSIASGVVFFFFFLWGFNYQRVPVKTFLGLQLEAPDSLYLAEQFREAAMLAAGARSQIPNISLDTMTVALLPENLEQQVAADLEATLERMGYPASGKVRTRMIRPGGWMLSLNVAGIYNPFTGEGNVSTALPAARIPFTMAHEMAHGYGFGDEGTCNFWALMACNQSRDPAIRYSGRMAWWLYLARELSQVAPYTYSQLRKDLSPGFATDILANRYNSRRYAGRASRFGSKVNDRFLKLQGIKEGVQNYNQVVLMYLAWNAK